MVDWGINFRIEEALRNIKTSNEFGALFHVGCNEGQFLLKLRVPFAGRSNCVIEEDLGPALALEVAREMVVYLKRSGGQEQYSAPLEFQARASDRFSELAAWIAGHLRHDLSIEALARRVNLSPRHFRRLFTASLGTSPAALIEGLRLDEARRHLTAPGATVALVAERVGFRSADSFRRAFERRFGIAPSAYGSRFSHRAAPTSARR